MKTKKKKRLGKVTLEISYVVDLDDPSMVDHAKECIYEDIVDAVKHNEVDSHINIDHDDGTLQESDIPSFLFDTEDWINNK